MYKKGQGLSMNVIIIAAIALLILVILSVLVLRTGGELSETKDCLSLDGASCEVVGNCPTGTIHNNARDASCNPGITDRSSYTDWCCAPL